MKLLFTLIIATSVAALALYIVTVQPWVRPTPMKPPAVSPERLQAHVRMLSETLHPRNVENLENLEKAADYVHAELAASGAEVTDQWFEVKGEKYRNIVARFGPAEGLLLVIGAHYDSFETTPGADDNASGVAGLIELAQLLGRNPPRQPVELVAYTLEEPPHFYTETMGSAHHARSLKDTAREVSLMLSLEMIGWFSDAPGSQTYPLPGMDYLYPDRGDFIAIIGRFSDWAETRKVKAAMSGAGDLPVHSMNTTVLVPGVDLSDHHAYWNEGYKALMITDTAFYRNPYYHEAGDTYDKLDYPRMAQVVQAVFAVVQAYSGPGS
jgi:Zn-dependent M28 family amino/carboxypeptidase